MREFGDFHLALSGGAIFEPIYQRLMYDPDCRRLPWRRTHLWIVDETCVPFDDPRSSFRMISEIVGRDTSHAAVTERWLTRRNDRMAAPRRAELKNGHS